MNLPTSSLSLFLAAAFSLTRFFFPARIQLQTTNSSNNVVAIFYSSSNNNNSNKQQKVSSSSSNNSEKIELVGNIYVRFRLQLSRETRAESKRHRDWKRITTQRLRTPSQWLCEWVLSGDMLAVVVAPAAGVDVVVVVGTT